MQLERAPVLGITIAVMVLVLECVGLLAYQRMQQEPVVATAIELDAPVVEEHVGWHETSLQRQVVEIQREVTRRVPYRVNAKPKILEPHAIGCSFANND